MTATTDFAQRIFTLVDSKTIFYSLSELAAVTGLSESTIRRCIRATDPGFKPGDGQKWPTLTAKRLPDGRLQVTRDQALDWIARFPDA